MYKAEQELRGQFQSIEQTRRHILELKDEAKAFFAGVKTLYVLGCGSSYSVAKSCAMQFSQHTGLPARAIAAGDLLVNFDAYRKMLPGAGLLLMSRSGSTSEILLAVQRCKKHIPDMRVASVCAVQGAPIAAYADLNIEIPWAFDHSVCQTQTVSNLYTAGLMLCGIAAENDALLEAVESLQKAAPAFCKDVEPVLERLGCGEWSRAVVLADSGVAGLAEEGALAFKEICQRPSNFYHVLDVRHGPIVLVDSQTLVIVFVSGGDSTLQADLVNDIAQHTGHLLVLKAADTDGLAETAVQLRLPYSPFDDVSAIFMIYCIQLLCLKNALHQGLSPDEPKDLASWIRLEA